MDISVDDRSQTWDRNKSTETFKKVVISDENRNRFRISTVVDLIVVQWQGPSGYSKSQPTEDAFWTNFRRLFFYHHEFIAMFGQDLYDEIISGSLSSTGQVITKFTVGGGNP